MASPDASPYVDLRLFDRDAQQIYEDAVANLATYLPEWVPREGHTEVLLLESMALEVAESVFAINRLPGAVVEVMLRLYGVERDPGTPPVVPVRFTVTDTNGHTIPAGVRVAVAISSDSSLVFTTDAPLLVTAGSLTGVVTATGELATSIANNLPASSAVELLDSVAVVDAVALDAPIGGGSDPEDDEAWFTRGMQRFARLAETLVLPRHFIAAALERPEVTRAFAVDNYNSDAGSGSPGSHAGHITVALYGNGANLSAAQKAEIVAAFDSQAQANLAVHAADPTITTVAVTAEVVGVPGFSVEQVQANVSAALAAYLSPEEWGWSATVYRNELIGLLDRVEGVERVTTITTPASDLTLTGVAPLAQLGTTTITVTGI